MKCPCYKCEERYNLCHDDCEKYKEWLKQKHNTEQWLKEQQNNAYIEDMVNRQRQRRKDKHNYEWWKRV